VLFRRKKQTDEAPAAAGALGQTDLGQKSLANEREAYRGTPSEETTIE